MISPASGIAVVGLPAFENIVGLDDHPETDRDILQRRVVLLGGIGLAIVIIGSFIGNISHGYLSDWIGRRMAFACYAFCAALTILAYMIILLDRAGLMLMAIPLGFFISGVYGSVGAILSELFPTLLRGIGAAFPWLVCGLSGTLGLGLAIAIFTSVAYALAALAVCVMPKAIYDGSSESNAEAMPSVTH